MLGRSGWSREESMAFNREFASCDGAKPAMDWKKFKIIHRSNPDQVCYPVIRKNGCGSMLLFERLKKQ